MIRSIFLRILKIAAVMAIVAVLFINLWKPFGSYKDNNYEKRTSMYRNGRFHATPGISVMNDKKSIYKNEETTPKGTIPVHHLSNIPALAADQMAFTWIGHSSSLLQMSGKNILIDPIFSTYSSPVQGFGPKRFSALPISIENMPNIDLIVISHDHYDHLDYNTIRKIDHKVKEYMVPLGIENHLIRWGVSKKKIHAVMWWDSIKIGSLTITSVPGRHYTGRLPWKSNGTLWSGFVFSNSKYTTYYTGDTGYGSFFKDIHKRFPKIDLLILEDGQYDVSWSSIHLLPAQHIKVMKQIHAKWTVPVHWGTFCLCYHAWDDPARQITARAKKENLNVATPKIGEIVNYNNISSYQQHWWEEVK